MPPMRWPDSTGSPTTRSSSTCGCQDANGLDVLDDALSRYPDMRCVVTAGFGSIESGGAGTQTRRRRLPHQAVPAHPAGAGHEDVAQRAAAPARERRAAGAAQRRSSSFGSLVGSQPADEAAVRDARAGLADEQHGPASRARRARARSSSRGRSITTARARDQPFVGVQRGGHSRKGWRRPSCSATSRARSPARLRTAPAVSKRPTRARSSSTRSRRCRWRCRPSSCGRCRSARSSASARRSPFKINTRVIAATNEDLQELVREGPVPRGPLLPSQRRRVILPPLRERQEDIPVLAQHFVQRACAEQRPGARRRSARARCGCMMHFAWPGNIRHLQNAIEHAVAMSGEATRDRAGSPAGRRPQPGDVRAPWRCRRRRTRASTSRRR